MSNVNKRCDGQAMKINGQVGRVRHRHARQQRDSRSTCRGRGYTRFKARGGLDNGGTEQGCGSTVQFLVYTQSPAGNRRLRGRRRTIPVAMQRTRSPISTWPTASKPRSSPASPKSRNITNIDIDHLGRVWVCEVKNYRKHNGSRPEGDRILVLEDTDGDGKCRQAHGLLSRPRHRLGPRHLRARQAGHRLRRRQGAGLLSTTTAT